MDKFYNWERAAEALEKSASENEEVTDRRLASLAKDTSWYTKYKIERFEGPTTLRLIQKDVNDRIAEEAVFTIQGIVSAKNLPPVTEKLKTLSQARYLRQGIALIGYNTATFEKAISNAQEIYGMFDRNVQDATLESWAITTDSLTQGMIFEASNRYLTSKRDAPNMQTVPILPSVDPRGILDKLTQEGYLHGEDNQVDYYQVHKNGPKGSKIVEAVNPQIFRLGDIVEVQVSFIAVPLKDNKNKMIVVLRSIALMDTQFSQEASKNRMKESEPTQKLTLKRRVGYGEYTDEEGDERMEVDKHVGQRPKTG